VADRQEAATPTDATASTGDGIDELEDGPMAAAEQAAAERLDEARALLAERAQEAREVLAERARTGGTEVASWARETGTDLAERAGPVIAERTEQAKDELQRRLQELEESLPIDRETAVPQLERGLWQAIHAALGVLLLLPKLLVRAVGGLGTVAEDVSERGLVVGERAREVAGSIPPSKRERRRRRWRTAAWTGTGFGVGLFVGWLVGRREHDMVTYEPTELGGHLEVAPVPPGPVASPLEDVDEPGEPDAPDSQDTDTPDGDDEHETGAQEQP